MKKQVQRCLNGHCIGVIIVLCLLIGSANGQNPAPEAGAISKAKLTGGVEMSFAYIPAGEFEMGSNNGRPDEKPVHLVTISRGFWMQTTEVTQAQWQTVMGSNPSFFKGCPNCPVERVSWDDAQEFIAKLNEQNDGYTYRLPTEAEWEYAARAGTTGDYGGNGNLDEMGWYRLNARSEAGGSDDKPRPVGEKQPNGWGLYDMHGNISEWVSDWYGEYPSESVTDPTGPSSGFYRVRRGGAWYNEADKCRSARRDAQGLDDRVQYLGFRLVRTLK